MLITAPSRALFKWNSHCINLLRIKDIIAYDYFDVDFVLWFQFQILLLQDKLVVIITFHFTDCHDFNQVGCMLIITAYSLVKE